MQPVQNNKIHSERIRLFPIKVTLIFLIFTEILYVIGPIDYNVNNYGYTMLYLLTCNFFLYKGYKSSAYTNHKSYIPTNIDKIIKFILFFSAIILIYKLYTLIGSISPSALYNKVYESILSPSDAYKDKIEGGSISSMTYIFMFLSPINSASIPIGIYYWKRNKRILNIITILLIIGEVLYWICIGTRKGIFDTILIVFFLFFASNNQYITNKNRSRKISLYIVVTMIIFIGYFVWSNMSRMGAENINEYGDLFYGIKESYKSLPSTVTATILAIEGYLCQGYYALSLALNEFMMGNVPFTFGCGNNFFTINVLERFNIEIIDNTYLKILYDNYGIDPYINWHSIYVWLANDFTFLGVPVILYIIGKLFARTWMGCIYGNFYAIAIFSLTMLMVVYSYANNQILSFSFIAFVVWLYLYLKNS